MVRHRMRSRRGGTRGGSSRSPVMPSPDSVSPASSANSPNPPSFVGHYPNTHSGRGRAWFHGTGRGDVAVRTANFPLPLHPAPHTKQFRFRSSLNRPVIVANVSITFTEEIEPSTPLVEHNDEPNRAEPSCKSWGFTGDRRADEDRATLYGKPVAGSQHVKEGKLNDTQASGSRHGDTSGTRVGAYSFEGDPPAHERGASNEDDDSNKYACPIMEEPAPNN